MTQIGMRELKENMGYFVALIKKGEPVLLKYRGQSLAIVKSTKPNKKSRGDRALTKLKAQGLIVGRSGKPLAKFVPVKTKGKPVSEMIIEDRE